MDLPAAELAIVVHSGPHDDIDVTYGRLGAAWRTEIGWPVFRLAR